MNTSRIFFLFAASVSFISSSSFGRVIVSSQKDSRTFHTLESCPLQKSKSSQSNSSSKEASQEDSDFIVKKFNELLQTNDHNDLNKKDQNSLCQWIQKNANIVAIVARTFGSKLQKIKKRQREALIEIWPQFMSIQLSSILNILKNQTGSLSVKSCKKQGSVWYYTCQVEGQQDPVIILVSKEKINDIQVGGMSVIGILHQAISEIQENTIQNINNDDKKEVIQNIKNVLNNDENTIRKILEKKGASKQPK